MTNINVPTPHYKIERESNDHPVPVLKIKYIGSCCPYYEYKENRDEINLFYPHDITIGPLETKILNFPVTVQTSIPCVSIIYGSQLIFRFGLTCKISIMPTNDAFLSTTVYNYTNKTITLPKNMFSVHCLTVISTMMH